MRVIDGGLCSANGNRFDSELVDCGYMLPIGFVILMVIFTNFTSMIGIAPYFPWAVPGLYAVSRDELTVVSYVVLACMCVAGYVATVVFWKRADQK